MKSVVVLWLYFAVVTALLANECEAKKSWADIAASPEAKAEPIETPSPWKNPASSASASSSPSGGGGVYSKLPSDAQSFLVRNVYDGDTLTLVDGRRVRFLGIDTPELEEKKPFAAEAKQYAKDYCHKQEIYLSFDPKSDSKDKYGRFVANVWVQLQGGSYLNVNEGLVANGLATVYLANKERKPTNFQTLLRLQLAARESKKGLWSRFSDYDVWVTRYGSAFHRQDCRHIARSRGLKKFRASAATDAGLHPCRTCLADQ